MIPRRSTTMTASGNCSNGSEPSCASIRIGHCVASGYRTTALVSRSSSPAQLAAPQPLLGKIAALVHRNAGCRDAEGGIVLAKRTQTNRAHKQKTGVALFWFLARPLLVESILRRPSAPMNTLHGG